MGSDNLGVCFLDPLGLLVVEVPGHRLREERRKVLDLLADLGCRFFLVCGQVWDALGADLVELLLFGQ